MTARRASSAQQSPSAEGLHDSRPVGRKRVSVTAPDEPSMTMVFHHPLAVGSDPSRGSSLRPAEMLRAFENIGYEVVQVTGQSRERARKIKQVLDDVEKGRVIDFVYGESATTPNALSDESHIPRHPMLDARFFRSMRHANVRVGVFYRDIYWRFDEYNTATGPAKRTAAKAFYRLDLEAYRRGVDVLFVPSEAMGDLLPARLRRSLRIVPLPPGGTPPPTHPSAEPRGGIRIIYVGGVSPPLYSLDRTFQAIDGREDVSLTVCCRPSERSHLQDTPSNCTIVHAQGSELDELYRQADLALALLGSHPNREFAIPIKVFEAIAHDVPVIVDRGTAVGDLVDELGLGVTIGQNDPFEALLDELVRDDDGRRALTQHVAASRDDHTWNARARSVVEALTAR